MASRGLRVTVLAEGPAETGATSAAKFPDALAEETLGAAHHLVRRMLAHHSCDTTFIAPQRKAPSGKHASGSDLHHPATLRKLLTIADLSKRPDLFVVLIDEDGVTTRHAELIRETEIVPALRVIGVARQEFEAWLLGDIPTTRNVLGPRDEPPHIESMPPGEAKALFNEWVGPLQHDDWRARRRELAQQLNIAELRARSRSFDRFARDIERAISPAPT